MWVNGHVIDAKNEKILLRTDEGLEISVASSNFLECIDSDILELENFDPESIKKAIAYREKIGETATWIGPDLLVISDSLKDDPTKTKASKHVASLFVDGFTCYELFGQSTIIIADRVDLNILPSNKGSLLGMCNKLVKDLCGNAMIRVWSIGNDGEKFNLEVFGQVLLLAGGISSGPEILKNLHFSPANTDGLIACLTQLVGLDEGRDILLILKQIVGFFRNPESFTFFESSLETVRKFKQYKSSIEANRLVYLPVPPEEQALRPLALVNGIYNKLLFWIVMRINEKYGFDELDTRAVKVLQTPCCPEGIVSGSLSAFARDVIENRLNGIARLYGQGGECGNILELFNGEVTGLIPLLEASGKANGIDKFIACHLDNKNAERLSPSQLRIGDNIYTEERIFSEISLFKELLTVRRDMSLLMSESPIKLIDQILAADTEEARGHIGVVPKNRRDRFSLVRNAESSLSVSCSIREITDRLRSICTGGRVKYVGGNCSNFFNPSWIKLMRSICGKSVCLRETEFFIRYQSFPSKSICKRNGHVFLSRQEERDLNRDFAEKRVKNFANILTSLKRFKSQSILMLMTRRQLEESEKTNELPETAPETPVNRGNQIWTELLEARREIEKLRPNSVVVNLEKLSFLETISRLNSKILSLEKHIRELRIETAQKDALIQKLSIEEEVYDLEKNGKESKKVIVLKSRINFLSEKIQKIEKSNDVDVRNELILLLSHLVSVVNSTEDRNEEEIRRISQKIQSKLILLK